MEKHLFKNCPSKEKCEICGNPHHTTLHFDIKKKSGQTSSGEAVDTKPKEPASSNTQAALQDINLMELKRQVPIMSLTALSKSTKKEVKFYAFLDTGAERNMASKELALRLGLWNPTGKTTIKSMTGRKEVKSIKTSVNLKTQNGGVACLEEMIFASDLEIPFSKNIPSKEDLEEHGKSIYKNFPIHG